MFLQLNYQKLEVYTFSKQLVLECYKLTKILPSEKKFSMCSQIRMTALSVHLNFAEGTYRKSNIERKRYFKIFRGSVVEIDAAIDIAYELKHLENYDTQNLSSSMINCFKLLSGLIKATQKN